MQNQNHDKSNQAKTPLPKLSKTTQEKRLYNRLSSEEAQAKLAAETFERTTISFYQYFVIGDPIVFRDELYLNFDKLGILGRVYLAHEGINAQISVPEHNVAAFRDYLYSINGLDGIRLNIAADDDGKSFWVLKIKVREKIVADGIEDPEFSMERRGKYLTAEEFNQMTEDSGVLVVDMRNHYEYEVGHFSDAVEVPSETFREQLPMAVEMLKEQKDKNIIMYCTGGIRCEKASAWMLHNGFENVYHLEGGIIKYANDVKQKGLANKFRGKNFVFDGRLAEQIGDEIIAHCHQCGKAADTHTNCANEGCHLLFIQCEECKNEFNGCCSQECMDIINLPEEEQKALRKGINRGGMIFNKRKK